LNDAGKMVGTYPAIPDLTANSDWVTKEVTLQVPTDATQLQLQPGLWGSKGVFEIDNLAVRVASTTTAPVPAPSVAADAPWPASAKVAWGSEPVDVQSSKRARINLNGVWKFSPAQSGGGQANTPPEKGWGYLGVPGNWRRYQEMIAKGTGPQWSSYNGITLSADGKTLSGAWYERRFKVPADWKGRHISIDFDRISTDATFWINDKPAGQVNWPEGEIDITNLVKAGKKSHCAPLSWPPSNRATSGDDGRCARPELDGQEELQTAGIVGNVTLQSRRAALMSAMFISTEYSLRSNWVLDVELSGVKQSGPVQLVASLVDEKGK
jgi:beta-galactosidase